MNHRPLTPRELTVLRLLATGITQKVIAKQMGLSPYTVADFALRARYKMGAQNTVHAVVTAQQRGLL